MGQLSPSLILAIILGYFLLLISISYFTKGKGDNKTFFTANKSSPWLLVAIGMIGASLSGVTFISIPGVVGKDTGGNINFSYMQMVFGYLLGYAVIALILLPIYYKYNLTSIYTFLDKRLGTAAYKTGSAYFLLSRTVGASLRLYLVAMIIDIFVTGPMGIPFYLTVICTIILIWVYTFQGGIKTIVFTDTLQTVCMLLAVILTIYAIIGTMDIGVSEIWGVLSTEGYNKTFYFGDGWNDPNNFFKQFISGALIAIVMTGLDQDMMQKNITCRTLKDAQKNVFTFSIILVFANVLFLTLGGLLYVYASTNGISIPEKADQLYPLIALEYLSPFVGVVFILGLIAAAYSSADSALTSLTTSFCIDFLGFNEEGNKRNTKATRLMVHVGFSLILLVFILITNAYISRSVINEIFQLAGYTYGPILGLFTFAIFTDLKTKNAMVIPICILSPILCYFIVSYSPELLGGFEWGNMLIALNGALTFIGLLIFSSKRSNG